MADLFAAETLPNGLTIEFSDSTKRYFGDYHRIQIEVTVVLADGQRHRFQTLERMGVSGGELEEVKHQVMDAFRSGTLKYMGSEQFPAKFVASLPQRKNKPLPGLR